MQATDTATEFLTEAEACGAYLEASEAARAAAKATAAAGRIERKAAKAAKAAWTAYMAAAKDAAAYRAEMEAEEYRRDCRTSRGHICALSELY